MKRLLFALPFVLAACDRGGAVTEPGRRLAPGAPSFLINPSGTVVVSPENMRGWAFYNDATDALCADLTCRMVVGPAVPLIGKGSAELATPTDLDRRALILYDYAGTRFDSFTELTYSTYRQTSDVNNILAIALQFNVDYDLNDNVSTFMGRLVFEPYQALPQPVVSQNIWQTWDALAGRWWGSKSMVTKGGAVVPNPCVQNTPCTRAQLLAAFPNIGVRAGFGGVVLKAGGSWPGFKGNVDNLTIGLGGPHPAKTTFDFEPSARGDCEEGDQPGAKQPNGSNRDSQADCNQRGGQGTVSK